MRAAAQQGNSKKEIRTPAVGNSKQSPIPNAQFPTPNPPVIADNIEVSTEGPEPWMVELAKMLILKDLPTGVIVGTASVKEVVKGPSTEEESLYEWHLTDVERAMRFRKRKGQSAASADCTQCDKLQHSPAAQRPPDSSAGLIVWPGCTQFGSARQC